MTTVILVAVTLVGTGLFAGCIWMLYAILTDERELPHMLRLALVLVDVGTMVLLAGSVLFAWRVFYVH